MGVTLGNSLVGLAIDPRLARAGPLRAYADSKRLKELIRESARQAGLGKANADHPLADLVPAGAHVLIKPNWVLHKNQAADLGANGHNVEWGMSCMVTHPQFILAAITELLHARPARITVADAPIQSCDFSALVGEEFSRELAQAGKAAGCQTDVVDLRRTRLSTGSSFHGPVENGRDMSRYVLFDLGADSMLESISQPPGRFRVTCYDPRKLAQVHRPGRHQYLLAREAFEADIIVSLPKLKMHRKAGITAALKNLVGLNGDKDFLPHHRFGGTSDGGDCYPGRSLRKWAVEALLDAANRRLGSRGHRFWSYWALRFLPRVAREEEGSLEGGWFGNDTCWRMVLDLNRILIYGRADGTLADEPQRRIWSLTDAVVCGEGNGPLAPSPLVVGAVTLSSDSPAADAVHAALLRLDSRRLSLVREALGTHRWPLSDLRDLNGIHASYQGRDLNLSAVARELGVPARPPGGWTGHVELSDSKKGMHEEPPSFPPLQGGKLGA